MPSRDTPPPAHPVPPDPHLLRKLELELALLATPHDPVARAAYLEALLTFASVRTGLTYAVLPAFGHPVALRCGTSDIIALLRACRDRVYDFSMRATPRRILVLGAHVGYGALMLARRFPDASIVCVEPNAAALPPLHGRYHLILQAEMAPGMASNANAWAHILAPRIA